MGGRIYLAASYPRLDEMRGVRDVLTAFGHTVTSRWIDQPPGEGAGVAELAADPAAYVKFAHLDIADLEAAETVMSFTGEGGRGGRHVEFGMAVMLGKRLVIVGPREHVFHTLPEVEWYPDWSRLVMAWSRT
jgi:hypothetical protein